MARGCLASAYRTGDTEIRHQRVARVEQNVGRFDVAVNHVAAVGVAQRVRHLARDLERLGAPELPFTQQALAQRLTLDVGHDIVKQPIGLIGVVERQDVRVVEPGGDLDLAEETGCSDVGGDIGSQAPSRQRRARTSGRGPGRLSPFLPAPVPARSYGGTPTPPPGVQRAPALSRYPTGRQVDQLRSSHRRSLPTLRAGFTPDRSVNIRVNSGGRQTVQYCRVDTASPSGDSEGRSNANRKEAQMSSVRVLVGTRKGAFLLTADGKRARWEVSGPHFGGWEIYHLKGSPADPNRLYASQSSGWFGQVIQRSSDGGKTWEAVGNKFEYDGVTGTHQWYDGTPHPWEFKRAWHLEPSLDDPDTVYAGIEDAALFRSSDGGQTWQELPGLREHTSGPKWQPGAGGLCLHTILLDRANPGRMFVAISAAGAFEVTTAARAGARSTRGSDSAQIPDQDAEVGHCVHRIAMHPSRPEVLFMQKHWDVMRSDNGGRIVARGEREPSDRLRISD